VQPGDIIHHYTIVAPLGAGGMGEVYLADDGRLGRKVALKVLPAPFAHDASRVRRFEQEARAVSALNHPHILTLFEIGRVGDRYFMATEFVDGSTLRAHLRERGRLPAAEAVRIAQQCAGALSSAHAEGIVHRDIKPENVMIRRDGHVKVLDFGLAKITTLTAADAETAEGQPNLTSAGVVFGTIGYLSPEQARGQTVDARTDVFSLGVVLYEMLTGTSPFSSPTGPDTMAAILRADPAPPSTGAPGVTPELDRIVGKALAKDRDDRYASVADLARDLDAVAGDLAFDAHPRAKASTTTHSRRLPRRTAIGAMAVLVTLTAGVVLWQVLSGGTPPPPVAPAGALQGVRTLAVLPFKLLGYPDASEHLGLGMADALIVKLTHLRELTVRPTSAVVKYQEGEHDVRAVGRALQVDAVLVGNVQRAGGRTRVTVQLVGTSAAGAVAQSIWSDEFTTASDDPLDVQERLATQLVEKLALRLTGTEQATLTARDTTSQAARQSYVQARYFWNKRTTAGFRRAFELFEDAVREDPQYAQAHFGQVLAWNGLLEQGAVTLDAALPKIRAALDRALAINPAFGEALAYRSFATRVYDWKFAAADPDSTRSIELEPNNPSVLQWRGVHLLAMGRADEAVRLHERSVHIDPVDMLARLQLCRALYLAKRHDEAIRAGRVVLDLDPGQSAAHEWIGLSLAALGRFDEALVSLRQSLTLAPGNPERKAALAYGYARAGRAAEARTLLTELEASPLGFGHAYHIATIYAGLGDRQQALSWLERALQERDGFLPNRVKLDPKLDALRAEPRFRDVLTKMGL